MWFLAALIAIPTALHAEIIYLPFEPGLNGLCVEHWNNVNLRNTYSVTILLLQYFGPLIIMMVSYIHIGYIIWVKPTPGEPDKERDRKISMSKKKVSNYSFDFLNVRKKYKNITPVLKVSSFQVQNLLKFVIRVQSSKSPYSIAGKLHFDIFIDKY